MMGFLHINTLDPDRSFKAFVRVMERFMKGLFDDGFKLLKTYFFKFNRVLELYAPDLAEHFKVYILKENELMKIIEGKSGTKLLYPILVYYNLF